MECRWQRVTCVGPPSPHKLAVEPRASPLQQWGVKYRAQWGEGGGFPCVAAEGQQCVSHLSPAEYGSSKQQLRGCQVVAPPTTAPGGGGDGPPHSPY